VLVTHHGSARHLLRPSLDGTSHPVACRKDRSVLTPTVPADHAVVAGLPHVRSHSHHPNNLGARAARAARTWVGAPYAWGGSSRSGVDCSGLVVAVYGRLGVHLPHQSDQLWHGLNRVKHLRLGDILAFGSGGSSGHVGIYIGHGRFVDAVGVGRGVQIGHLWGAGRHTGFLGAVRVRVHKRRPAKGGKSRGVVGATPSLRQSPFPSTRAY
jgi:hypothetical protein